MRDVGLRERPRTIDGVKRALNKRGISVEQGRMILYDRSEWTNEIKEKKWLNGKCGTAKKYQDTP